MQFYTEKCNNIKNSIDFCDEMTLKGISAFIK